MLRAGFVLQVGWHIGGASLGEELLLLQLQRAGPALEFPFLVETDAPGEVFQW